MGVTDVEVHSILSPGRGDRNVATGGAARRRSRPTRNPWFSQRRGICPGRGNGSVRQCVSHELPPALRDGECYRPKSTGCAPPAAGCAPPVATIRGPYRGQEWLQRQELSPTNSRPHPRGCHNLAMAGGPLDGLVAQKSPCFGPHWSDKRRKQKRHRPRRPLSESSRCATYHTPATGVMVCCRPSIRWNSSSIPGNCRPPGWPSLT